jgi:hypothetical protein
MTPAVAVFRPEPPRSRDAIPVHGWPTGRRPGPQAEPHGGAR